jgi:hypothetical protein
VCEIDFTSKMSREKSGHVRDVETEKRIEATVTQIIRENFSFRFIEIENQSQRMGRQGLESRLIGTIAGCGGCRPSDGWLGCGSPKTKIRDSGLWLEHYLHATPISEDDKNMITDAVQRTIERLVAATSAKDNQHEQESAIW